MSSFSKCFLPRLLSKMGLATRRPEGSNYIVDFNADAAWTLTYDDACGRFIFVFERGDTSKKVSLHRVPIENNRVVQFNDDAMLACVDQAFERTKAYLVSCRYEVEAY
ncbi:MAG TPA: hypothetical protein VK663_15055 [Burkholderiales bacterium]|nr:hypothetical protein [Burkholderiales bacterium]